MKYCQVLDLAPTKGDKLAQKDIAMVISLDNSRFTSLNLLPKNFDQEMSAVVEYRLVNKLEQQFVWETLMLMGVGIVLIVFFGTVLLKALS